MKRVHRRQVGHEVAEIARWYDQQKNGLGSAFLEALRTLLEEIERFPERFPVFEREMRRALMPKPYPYLVFYFVDQARDRLAILAVVHQSRKPGAWQERS